MKQTEQSTRFLTIALALCLSLLSACSRTPSATDRLDGEVTRLLEGLPATLELAQANLLCSQGLPGSTTQDTAAALEILGTWAAHVLRAEF